MASERDEESSSFPLTPIYIDKKNRYNITDITVITEEKKSTLTRSPTSFYISQNIAKGWRQYCQMSGKPTHELTEAAFIDFMRGHPLQQATLNLTQDLAAYAPDVKDRLRNKIIKEKIRSTMATLRRVQENGRGDTNVFRKQLQKLALQATNLKKPDSELLELLKEVEELI